MITCNKNVEINECVEKVLQCGHEIISKHMNEMWNDVLEYWLFIISSWTIWRTVKNKFTMQWIYKKCYKYLKTNISADTYKIIRISPAKIFCVNTLVLQIMKNLAKLIFELGLKYDSVHNCLLVVIIKILWHVYV